MILVMRYEANLLYSLYNVRPETVPSRVPGLRKPRRLPLRNSSRWRKRLTSVGATRRRVRPSRKYIAPSSVYIRALFPWAPLILLDTDQ